MKCSDVFRIGVLIIEDNGVLALRPNITSCGVIPFVLCTDVLYANVASGKFSSHVSGTSYT
jgi:hypothetical protein